MQNNISYDTKKIIKKYRIKNKLKQTQMVDLMGCSISTIRKIETDETYLFRSFKGQKKSV